MSETADIGTFLAAMAGLGVFFLLVFIVLWVLKSIGLAQMAKNKGIENEWLAWLPIADLYIMGALVEEISIFNIKISNLGLWFPMICLIGVVLSGIPFLGLVISLALLIFQIVFMFNFFKMYSSQAALFTVLSILLAFLFPIFVFFLRNNPIIDFTAGDPVSGPNLVDEPNSAGAEDADNVQSGDVTEENEEIKI